MVWLRELFWISVVHDFRVTCISRYIQTTENTTAYKLSLLHKHLSADNFLSLLHSGSITNNCINLPSTSLSLLPTQVQMALKSGPQMKNVHATEARTLPLLQRPPTSRSFVNIYRFVNIYFGYNSVPYSALTLLRYVTFLSCTLSSSTICNYFFKPTHTCWTNYWCNN